VKGFQNSGLTEPGFCYTVIASMDGTIRKDIHPGLAVVIVKKEDQPTGKMTQGIVRDILTSAPVHPRGIKVRLESGEVGRVQHIQE
jgi:uncharacterized repeat protein (TIGR03833 family)